MGNISVRLADLRPNQPRRVVVDGVPVAVVRVVPVCMGRSIFLECSILTRMAS